MNNETYEKRKRIGSKKKSVDWLEGYVRHLEKKESKYRNRSVRILPPRRRRSKRSLTNLSSQLAEQHEWDAREKEGASPLGAEKKAHEVPMSEWTTENEAALQSLIG